MEAPEAYKTAAMCNLAGGGFTLVWSGMLFLGGMLVCVGFWHLIPMAAAGYQVYVGMAMNKGEATPDAKNASIAGIAAGILGCNPVSLAISAYGFMQINDDEVAGWIESNS